MKNTTTKLVILFLLCSNVFLGQSFGDKHIITTGGMNQPIATKACDIDNDGDVDVIATDEQKGVTLYVNNGNGNFDFPIFLSTLPHPTDLEVNDYDKDGDMDIFWITPDSWSVVILENLGNLEFALPTAVTTAIRGTANFCFSDITNNGYDDIIVTGIGNEYRLSLIRNNGDNTFSDPEMLVDSIEIYSFISADVDNDSDNDILYTKIDNSPIILLENIGNGIFGDPGVFLETSSYLYSPSLSSLDADNDGDIDIVFASKYDSLRFLINDNSGNFQISKNNIFEVSGNDKSIPVDYDNDGDMDLIRTSAGCFVIHENVDGNFLQQFNSGRVGLYESDFTFGDINNDSNIDLIFSTNSGNYVGCLIYDIIMPFQKMELISSQAPSLLSSDIMDFNGDEYLDIVVNQYDGGFGVFYPIVYTNTEHGLNMDYSTIVITNPYASTFIYHDFNDDGFDDVLSYTSSLYNEIKFHFQVNQGDGTFVIVENEDVRREFTSVYYVENQNYILGVRDSVFYKITYNDQWNLAIQDSVSFDILNFNDDVRFADFNNDGYTDILIGAYFQDRIDIIYGNETFVDEQINTISDINLKPYFVNIADINGDGYPDVVYSGSIDNGVYECGWYKNNANGEFTNYKFNTQNRVFNLVAIDIDNDNNDELIACTMSELLLFKNIDNEEYTSELLEYSFVDNGFAFDIDYDGDLDFVSYAITTRGECRWYENTFINAAVSDIEIDNKSIIYPNPAANFISFSSEKEITKVKFYNLHGQNVLSIEMPDEDIDLSSLNSGTYLVKAYSDNNVFTEKLIISK